MFKTKQEIIVIQAEAKEPIQTRAVFWSHDKGTAKLIFQLQKDYMNQPLSAGTIVPILLEFNSDTAEGGRGRHIYHALIEDAINGIMSIVLEDNILGYVGRVEGSIYIELPDSRSLDTAGRFTFDIKRSPIDENVPELEDYYWQGFNEIMAQYHQTIATIKLEAKTLLDSLTADVTTAQNKVTTLEQSITTANTNLNTRINEINKKIDDNDVFTKQESSANVVYQLIGKEKVLITLSSDFKDKVAGSLVENTNIASSKAGSYLYRPDEFVPDNFVNYQQLSNLGDVTLYSLNKVQGNMIQLLIKYDIVDLITKNLNESFWLSQGATTNKEKSMIAKSIVKNIEGSVWGFGSSANGLNLNLSRASYINDSFDSWIAPVTSKMGTIAQIKNTVETPTQVETAIDGNGIFNQIVYADPSDGVTGSSSNIDYTRLDITIELSMNDFLQSMIANNHVENLATPEEAKAGTDTTKTMTPATTAQSIDNRAVTLASNQTIGGIKNFKDGLMINDVSLSTITRKVIYEADGVGGYFNAADKFTLGASGKIDKIVLLWSRVDDTAGTLLNYSWSQTVLSPDDLVVGNSYRIQMTTDNYKFVTFANESGNVTISGANENSVAPNRIYRIKRIIAYLKN
ncbi:BppU family phage baseplate upper protein [Enterococcus xiangfangensis]|nr:phage baseplate upper protein [Enterococcus asini]